MPLVTRWLLVGLIAVAIPYLVMSGLRRQFATALSVTATVFLIFIGVRLFTGLFFYSDILENMIGVLALTAIAALAAYTAIRYVGDRTVRRKLRERRQRPDAHRSLLDTVRRSLKI